MRKSHVRNQQELLSSFHKDAELNKIIDDLNVALNKFCFETIQSNLSEIINQHVPVKFRDKLKYTELISNLTKNKTMGTPYLDALLSLVKTEEANKNNCSHVSGLSYVITNPKKTDVVAFSETRNYFLVQNVNNAFVFNYEHGTEVLEQLQQSKAATTDFILMPLKEFLQ